MKYVRFPDDIIELVNTRQPIEEYRTLTNLYPDAVEMIKQGRKLPMTEDQIRENDVDPTLIDDEE